MKLKSLLRTFVMVILITAPLLLSSCKTTQKPVVLTRDLNVKDTLITHEVESIVLPQRNYIVFENPCEENELRISDQTITNENSSISISDDGGNLVVDVDIDSIVSSRLSEISAKSKVERIEIPVEVEVPVRNPINLYMVIYAVAITLFVLRKPIMWLARKIIIPIP